MGDVVRFPVERRDLTFLEPLPDRGADVVILPVIRVERCGGKPEAPKQPNAKSGRICQPRHLPITKSADLNEIG